MKRGWVKTRFGGTIGFVRFSGCAGLGLVVLSTVGACSDQSGAEARTASALPLPPSAGLAGGELPNVFAKIGSESITFADVRLRVGDELDQLEAKYRRDRYKLADAALQQMVHERVLTAAAREKGKTVDELLLGEGGSLEPTDADVSSWYEANKARLGGQPFEQLKPRIVDYLRLERRDTAIQKVVNRFEKDGKLSIYLEPYRASFNNAGSPSKGALNAPVTLVEFSDFQCPYCRGFVPTLKQVETTYRDRVRIVYRQYPIPSLHPFAPKAAEASLCAHEQGKFWELHDLMFMEQDRLSVDELKSKATRLGMDRGKFDSCLDSGRFAQQVQNDVREGTRAGVTGTPAIYINGVLLEGGAVAFDAVARALDSELDRAKR